VEEFVRNGNVQMPWRRRQTCSGVIDGMMVKQRRFTSSEYRPRLAATLTISNVYRRLSQQTNVHSDLRRPTTPCPHIIQLSRCLSPQCLLLYVTRAICHCPVLHFQSTIYFFTENK